MWSMITEARLQSSLSVAICMPLYRWSVRTTVPGFILTPTGPINNRPSRTWYSPAVIITRAHATPAFLPHASQHVHFFTTWHMCISYHTPHVNSYHMSHLHFCRMPHSKCIFYHMTHVHFLPHAALAFLTTRHTRISYRSHTCISAPWLTACAFFTTWHMCLPHATPAFLPHASHVHFCLPHGTCAFLTTRHTLILLTKSHIRQFLIQMPIVHFCRPSSLGHFLPQQCHICIAYHTQHVNSYHMPHILEFLTQMPMVHFCSLSSLGHFLLQHATDALLTTRHSR